MDFGLSEVQTLLQQSLRGYLGDRLGLERVRQVMESRDGFDRTVLRGLAEQGVSGVLIDTEHGGSQMGLLDAAVIAEELGRAAAPYSFHTAAVMAPLAIALGGSDAQKSEWLVAVAGGERHLSFVFAPKLEHGTELNGTVEYVADAATADAFVVYADDAAFLVAADAPGLHATALRATDLTRRLGVLRLDGVKVESSMRLQAGDTAADAERIRQAGRIAIAADALGAAERGLEAAVEYAQTRKQFGRAVASFQAVKHMCAETYAELEPLRALLWYAAFAWDERREDAAATAASLKAHAADVATRATTTCTQVFGGMGFTWECDMHLWFKRAGYDRQVLGGPEALRAEAAALLFD